MSGAPNNRRRRGVPGGEGHGADERWLLTYADMITLLMALFIVMWSISAVNISKFEELKISLKAAFSGKIMGKADKAILDGGQALLQPDGGRVQPIAPERDAISLPKDELRRELAKREADNLARIRREIEAYARSQGLSGRLRTSIDQRGLVIRLLTDDLLFDTGQAIVKSRSFPLLRRISKLLVSGGITNSVRVEGNTDAVPISTAQFRSNWELSTARATAVLEVMLEDGVAASRLSVAGYADQRPVATNATGAGRARNRRVDLVVLRRFGGQQGVR